MIATGTVKIARRQTDFIMARTYAYGAAGKTLEPTCDIEKPGQPSSIRCQRRWQKQRPNDVKHGETANSRFVVLRRGGTVYSGSMMCRKEEVNSSAFRKTAPKWMHRSAKGEALLCQRLTRSRRRSGNQISVFNRRGARPFNLEEMQRMYLRAGELYTVTDDVPPRPRRPQPAAETASWRIKLSGLTSLFWLPIFVGGLLLIGGVRIFRRKQNP